MPENEMYCASETRPLIPVLPEMADAQPGMPMRTVSGEAGFCSGAEISLRSLGSVEAVGFVAVGDEAVPASAP